MKKMFLATMIFLFISPLIIQADSEGARNDLNRAESFASEAEMYARKAYMTGGLSQAQFNARKAEAAAVEAQKAIQSALANLD